MHVRWQQIKSLNLAKTNCIRNTVIMPHFEDDLICHLYFCDIMSNVQDKYI